MARKKVLADLGDTDLLERLGESKEELFNLRFQLVTGQLENHSRLGQVKKEVARLLTELRAREIEAAESVAAVEEVAESPVYLRLPSVVDDDGDEEERWFRSWGALADSPKE